MFIVDDAAGIEFTVTKSSTSAIPAEKIDLSGLVEGTYTHAILMVGNSVKTKMNAKFSEDFRGANGNGAFCYSINAVEPPHFYWSMSMFRKRRTENGEQATEAGRDCLEVKAS